MTLKVDEKKRMVEAEQLNLHLEGIERRLQSIVRSRAEAKDLLSAIDHVPGIAAGDELLVPIATGIFVKAHASAPGKFFLNVGDGVVAEKSPADVRAMVVAQIARLDAEEQRLHTQFEAGLEQLQEMQSSFAPKE